MLFYDRSCNYASGTYRKSRVKRLSTDEAQLSTTKCDGMWDFRDGALLLARGHPASATLNHRWQPDAWHPILSVAYDQHASPRARVALYRCPVRCLRSSAGSTKGMPQGPIPCTCTTVSSFVRK